jgi:DNA modification methylase
MVGTRTRSRRTVLASRPAATDAALPVDDGDLTRSLPDRAALRALLAEVVPLERLHPDPANPRRIDASELDALERSLRQFGFVEPVVARRADGTVIGGHQRLVAARRLGYTEVPVIWVDLSLEQARLLGLALNRISGDWDEALLARLLSELADTPELDISLSGFGDEEIGELLRSLDARERRDRPEAFDLEAALASTQTPRTRPGDLWLLGEHRLLCGDATAQADVARLLGGQPAAMAFTDPPYNVALGDHGGHQAGTRRRRIENDALDPGAWEAFVRGWARTLLGAVNGAIYCSMSSKEWPLVSRALAEEGGHWSDTLIWAKDRFVLGRADFQRAYEPIWYGWREGAAHRWYGGRDESDVWQIARPADAPLHPVMKPLGLMERAIELSSRTGERVLDLFVGSGSTLIACERTGRSCVAMELDPRYVDVAVARWESFSRQTARLSDD